MNGTTTRVLVTDAQDRPGLAAIRSLHAAGFEVGATAIRQPAPGFWSRGCSVSTLVSNPADDVLRYVGELREFAVANHFDILVAGTDETLFAVSMYRDRLSDCVELGLPPHAVVLDALDKTRLDEEARAAGLAGPESRVCDSPDSAREAAHEFGYPALVKPRAVVEERDGRLVRFPSRIVNDDDELHETQMRIGTCIVQRRISGTVMAFAGVATDGGLVASVLSRYRRVWPPEAGSVAFSETVPMPPVLREQVQTLVAGLGWTGLFELELMETDDGTIAAIDFNPRLYGSLALAGAAGVPVAAIWCRLIQGDAGDTVTGRPGCFYRWEDTDLRNMIWLLRQGRYTDAARAMRPHRGTVHAYFQSSDPAPLLARSLELVSARRSRADTHPAAGSDS